MRKKYFTNFQNDCATVKNKFDLGHAWERKVFLVIPHLDFEKKSSPKQRFFLQRDKTLPDFVSQGEIANVTTGGKNTR